MTQVVIVVFPRGTEGFTAGRVHEALGSLAQVLPWITDRKFPEDPKGLFCVKRDVFEGSLQKSTAARCKIAAMNQDRFRSTLVWDEDIEAALRGSKMPVLVVDSLDWAETIAQQIQKSYELKIIVFFQTRPIQTLITETLDRTGKMVWGSPGAVIAIGEADLVVALADTMGLVTI